VTRLGLSDREEPREVDVMKVFMSSVMLKISAIVGPVLLALLGWFAVQDRRGVELKIDKIETRQEMHHDQILAFDGELKLLKAQNQSILDSIKKSDEDQTRKLDRILRQMGVDKTRGQ
jgi:hypothetical protein